MKLMEALAQLTGELDEENQRSTREITLVLSRHGLIVRGRRNINFMQYICHMVIAADQLDQAIFPEIMIKETITKVRESLTFPEDKS